MLTVDGLTRSFRGGATVGPVSLTVEPGERVALRGPNGSGKSTIIRCIAGTLTPTQGEVRVGDERAGTLAARRLVGSSLGQERSFHLRLTGRENLLLFARLRFSGREASRRVGGVVEELGLADIARRRVDRCSTGMVQRLAFARALLANPPLLVLDEPTRSLDFDAFELIWAAIERRDRAAILLATHDARDAARCERSVELG